MPVSKPKKASDGFAFINVAHPDEIRQRSTQKVIRSSAMAAIGRARRTRKEKPVFIELNIPREDRAISDADGIRNVLSATEVVSAYRALFAHQRIPPALPHLGMFAVEPDNRARELLHFMSGEASHVYRPFREEWFYMALLVPSSYNLCLANAALFMDQYVTHKNSLEYTDSVESTKYYSRCLSQVSRQLACQTQSTSEGVVTTVLGFICHSLATGKWDMCEMHMQGLECIIRLRGGFDRLGDFSPLFASWFDIMNSAVQDTPPRFPYPARMIDDSTELEVPSKLAPILVRLGNMGFDVTCLIEGLSKMARLASYLNKHAHQPQFWKAGMDSTKLIGPTMHCVLLIPRLDLPMYLNDDGPCLPLLLQELIRVALLIFSAMLKKGLSFISDELELFLERFSVMIPLMAGLSDFPELRIWACLVAACAQEDLITPSLISEIRRAMRDMKIQRSEDVITIAKEIIWIHHLLDPNIERVTRQIDGHSNASAVLL